MRSGSDLFVMGELNGSSLTASTSEFEHSITVRLNKSPQKFVVEEQKQQDQLRNRGFGEKEDGEYVLKPYEALYLCYTKKLTVKDQDILSFEDLGRIVVKRDRNILTKFMIYRDLRSRGYIPKEGFGFGVDFRVYERGEYEKKAARYVIFGISEGTKIKSMRLAQTIDQIEKMGKEAVVAVIERRGEVIYYKMSKVKFPDNRKMVNNRFIPMPNLD